MIVLIIAWFSDTLFLVIPGYHEYPIFWLGQLSGGGGGPSVVDEVACCRRRPKRSDLNEVVWVTYSPVSSVVVGHPYYGFR